MTRSIEQRSWLSHWLTSPLIRRPVYSPTMEPAPALPKDITPAIELLLADLSCNLVSSQQLPEQLPGLLVPVTTWYHRLLTRFDARLVSVYLPTPVATQPIEVSLGVDDKAPPGDRHHTPRGQAHSNDHHHTRINPHSDVHTDGKHRHQSACWIELPLLRSADNPTSNISAWLRLSDCATESHDDIRTLLTPLRRAMVKGLTGWWQHQDTLHQQKRDTLERERRWQAAELHDSVAQVLGYVRLRSAQLATRCHSIDDASLASHADDLSQQCHHAYRQTRELIAMSRLAISGDQFLSALREAIADIESRCTLVFELDNRCGELVLTDVQATQALYIIREALCNVVRHARASHVRIKLYDTPHQRVLLVEDNGTGIQRTRQEGSFGLQIMAERAQRMGGKLVIRQRQPNGTRIELTLPSADSHSF